MKRILPICRSLFDRVAALLLLIMLAPSLALVAFLLRTNTDEPILVTDDLVADGTPLRTYRFRTTGRGTSAFRSIGYFLRLYSVDELPGLWAVVRGWISLTQFFRLARVPADTPNPSMTLQLTVIRRRLGVGDPDSSAA